MRLASREEILRYHDAKMTEPPFEEGLIAELEAPRIRKMRKTDFVLDLSEENLHFKLPEIFEIHGSYLVGRKSVLLFGSSNLVSQGGHWFNEARRFKHQWLDYMNLSFFNELYPGFRPKIRMSPSGRILDVIDLANSQTVRFIDEPVFLATPQEAPIWGRWICTVIPKVHQYLKYGGNRKFMCHVQNQWQRDVLNFLGIKNENILPHDIGATYICRDLLTVEQTDADLKISDEERDIFYRLTIKCYIPQELPKKIFVARLTRSLANPYYRVLQNEAKLAEHLIAKGFVVVEPEYLPLIHQVAVFSKAQDIVFIGGSAIFNAVFCPPDARVVTIESSATYVNTHAGFFSSLGLAHGVIFGRQDPMDESASHRRWSLNLEPAVEKIMQYCEI